MRDFNEFGFRKRIRRSSEINLASMMDMAFILLIFFVVTTNFTQETGIDINKPKASTAQELGKSNILIGVTKEGAIHVNESRVSLGSLQTILRRYMAEDPERAVVIIADRDASVSTAIDVLDECNKARVKKVSISTEAE